ncbi:unnamed protein product [Prorocentrum cordatum]|uniref:Uncharacterized protein n=1 Tax=Prorocentrum cordatum TaxID=2364126 RepID=A0ABN9XJQ3_9DINO|nr:unnamed protein product [Polarella glacialis]
MLRVPQTFARAAAGSVAFGNSTGMPLVLLQALTPSLIANGILEESPLLYLPVYLVLSPVLQWTIGPAIFQAPKLEDGAAPLARDGDGESETASDESRLRAQSVTRCRETRPTRATRCNLCHNSPPRPRLTTGSRWSQSSPDA